jgi:hypothetical protein
MTFVHHDRNPRKHLRPRHGGPWLEDREDALVLRWMLGGGLALCLSATLWGSLLIWWYKVPPGTFPYQRYEPPGILLFLAVIGFIACLYGVAGVVLGACVGPRLQLCPRCLGTMRSGATTCPHCHDTPTEDAQHAVAPPRR